MGRVFIGTFAAALLAAVALVGAQQPTPAGQQPAVGGQQPPAAPQKPAEQKSPSEAKTQTITGCIEKGAGADSFILAEASTGPAPGAKPGEKPAGTTGATKSYALMAKPSEDLSKHVGHRVEITGTVSAAPPAASPAPGASTQPKETLNVQSLKMVSTACP
jgi:hypothetical protein